MFIIGHRGAAGYEPENTLRAVNKGMECAQYVEVDVRKSRDGVPVIIHDAMVDRTTNGIGRVNELDLEALRLLNAGKGERIPTLGEVLSVVKGHCGLVVELKEPEGNGPVFDLLGRIPDSTILIVSFHEQALREAEEVLPRIRRGLIFSREHPAVLERATAIQATMVFPKISIADLELVNKAHLLDLLVVPWTLNNEREIRLAHRIQADGFVTDYPCWAEKVMKQLA